MIIMVSRCNETNCFAEFKLINQLRKHLKSEHNLMHYKEKFEFNSEENFLSWKSEYQIKHLVSFIFKDRQRDSEYYCCNRSGHYTSTCDEKIELNTVKRQPPQRKTIKIGDNCTCTLVVKRNDSKIYVKVNPVHYNHSLDDKHLKKLPISKPDIKNIITKLEYGVSTSVIRKQIFDEANHLPPEDLRPVHFVSRQNLHHIKNKNITVDGRYHSEDYLSVSKWIEKYPNYIIYHKFQGERDQNYPVSTKILSFYCILLIIFIVYLFLYITIYNKL